MRVPFRVALVSLAPLGVVVSFAAGAPGAVARAASAVLPGCLYDVRLAGSGHRRLVALTIDDGPDPASTPVVLDSLRAHGAHATFFLITNRLRGADSVVARLRREGHEVGNHFTLERASIALDSAAFERDLAAADSALRPYAPVRWARPGSGWYSPRMVRAMRRSGYACALGSVYPFDAALGWPGLSSRFILAHLRPGAVIVLHEGGERGARTAAVLGRVLPAMRARGFEVVTLTELVAAGR